MNSISKSGNEIKYFCGTSNRSKYFNHKIHYCRFISQNFWPRTTIFWTKNQYFC